MRGAKNSKTMLPCGRRVHLYNSVSFKMVFEKIQTNHKDDAKIDPETIDKPI